MNNIIILDCGSSFLRRLSDKLKQLNTTVIVVPSDYPVAKVLELDPAGIIISGSGSYVNALGAEEVDTDVYSSGIPLLGICYGIQRMAVDLGGAVKRMPEIELGCVPAYLDDDNASVLFRDFADEEAPVWMAHTCLVTEVPPGFTVTASTDETEVAAMEDVSKALYGVQFHPEHLGSDAASQAGTAMLWSFLQEACGVG